METTKNMRRLVGDEAIVYARQHGLMLCKYNDPIEEAREDVSIEDAEEILSADARLIYIDVPQGRYDVVVIGTNYLLLSTDDAAAAEELASAEGSSWYDGTAVIDHEAGTIDYGDRVEPWAGRR